MTTDILSDLLGGAPPALPAVQLRYDYSQIEAQHRDAVQDAAVAIVRAGRRAQESMLDIGRRLAEVKSVLPFGQFSDWCEVEFALSQRTAQRMMAVAETFGERGGDVSLLSDSALYLLSGPSVPEEAREAVIAEAQEKGSSPTKGRVQAVIAEHRRPAAPRPVPAAPAAPREARSLEVIVAGYQLEQAAQHLESARSMLGEREDIANGLSDVLAQLRQLSRMLNGHA